jgi:hypothetical protein
MVNGGGGGSGIELVLSRGGEGARGEWIEFFFRGDTL